MGKLTIEEYTRRLNQKYPNEYTILGDYLTIKDPIKIKHNKCGYIWSPPADSMFSKHKNNIICPLCNNHVVIAGINDICTTNPELANLLWNINDGKINLEGSRNKVDWRCPDCGSRIKNIPIYYVKDYGFSCNKCSVNKSFPNRIMYNLLSQLNIKFEPEKRFNWCCFDFNNRKSIGIYDFYIELNNNKYIIEMDGGFHFKDNELSGETLDDVKYRDSMKDLLAKEHGIEVIRINCKKLTSNSIKTNILESKLSTILNLEIVNWKKCFYQSCDNIIKECCKLFKNGEKIKDISVQLNISQQTIIRYLKIGNDSGLCKYEPFGKSLKVVCVDEKKVFRSESAIAKYYHTSHSSIDNSCKTGSRVSKFKYIFMFLDDYINKYGESGLCYI